jgi:fibronectin type 3 domain-containing protein
MTIRARIRRRWSLAALTALLVLISAAATAQGAGTTVSGTTDPSEPLTIEPSSEPVVTSGIGLGAGARLFVLDPLPKAMVVRRVTIGDLARDVGCGTNAGARLEIVALSSSGDLGGGTPVAESSSLEPLTAELGRVTWLVDATALSEDHTYAFVVTAPSGECRAARVRTWEHNAAVVDGGDRACAVVRDGTPSLWRLWHEQEADESEDCPGLGTVGGLDVGMPTGWTQVTLEGVSASIDVGAEACAGELGARAVTWGRASPVCQLPQFDAPGMTVADGWYYGLPWEGAGLDGSPRDLHLSLEPDVLPSATTEAATDVGVGTATLNGTVEPGGSPTDYWFEWGADTSYGNMAPLLPAEAGEGEAAVPVDAPISGLRANRTYHYRLAASHGGPPVYGDDETFRTDPPSLANLVPPTLVPTVPTVGEAVKASLGTWTTAFVSHRWQWERCDSRGAACGAITGATRSRYVPVAEDLGQTLRVVLTAQGPLGPVAVESAVSRPVQSAAPAVAPSEITLPTVDGLAQHGEQLHATTGRWSGTRPFAIAYQWRRCDAEGAACADLGGATGRDYAPTAADVGGTLRVHVVATNGQGSDTATSAATDVVSAMPPSVEESPIVTGYAGVGETLVATTGAWSGATPISYAFEWERCLPVGDACEAVDGARSASYVVQEADAGSRLRVRVSASNASDTRTAASALGAIVATADVTNAALPTIAVEAGPDGGLLAADPGSWSGTGELSYSYRWQRCSGDETTCTNVPYAVDSEHQLTAADVDAKLRVVVTARGDGGIAVARSALSAEIEQEAPAPGPQAPWIDGEVGELFGQPALRAEVGTWYGTQPLTFSYQWRRCDASTGRSCTDDAGATEPGYEPRPLDLGLVMRVVVTAANAAGEDSATSAATSAVGSRSTLSESASPAVAGRPQVGQTLIASSGEWSGTGTVRHAYQWQRCDGEGEHCDEIVGATSSTYPLLAADVGHVVAVVVTATDDVGSASDTAFASAPTLAAGGPSNEAAPSVGGAAQEGAELTASAGEWSGRAPISYAYEWQRCDEGEDQCWSIPGATAATYTATAEDVGTEVRVAVTATDADGATGAVSTRTAAVEEAELDNLERPTVAGVAGEGETLTADPGTWDASAEVTYAYRWQRCEGGADGCANIAEASRSTYVLGEADVGLAVRVVVTARSAWGAQSAPSAPTDAVTPAVPRSVVAPSLSGSAVAGQTLTLDPGAFVGNAPLELSYAWGRCDAAGEECVDVEGATTARYVLTSEDVGATIRGYAVASNRAGSDRGVSAASDVVQAAPPPGAPANTAPPTVGGAAQVGASLTADPGRWTGNAPISYGFQWEMCRASGEECFDVEAGEGGTSATIALGPFDLGWILRVRVTATNELGETSASSAYTDPVTPPVVQNVDPPTIAGAAVVGTPLRADEGTWTGAAFWFYQWQRCDRSGGECADIELADDEVYRPTYADLGGTVRVVVTGTNYGDTRDVGVSDATEPIAAATPPSLASVPAVEHEPRVDAILLVGDGEWSGSQEIEVTHRWQRCDAGGEDCAEIAGADENSYRVVGADVGATLRVAITATNGAGSVTVETDHSAVVPDPQPLLNVDPPTMNNFQYLAFGHGFWAFEGQWLGAADVTEQWQRCDPLTADPATGAMTCTDISGASGPEPDYTPQAADVGYRLRLKEIASSATDTDSIVTAPSPTTVASSTDDGGGAYAGLLVAGEEIVADSTVVSDAGLDVETVYRFVRVEDGGEEGDVELQDGADASYELTEADVGHAIRIEMIASVLRADHATTVDTHEVELETDAVEPPPTADVAPSVRGSAVVGAQLTADVGRWSGGGGELSYTYRWRRCDATGAECDDVVGADGAHHRLAGADLGATLRVVVTAANGPARGTATSTATSVVGSATPPASTGVPTISGTAADGETLTADPGTWSGSPEIEHAYQWQRCDDGGAACEDLEGEEEAEYEVSATDVAATLRVRVEATNAAGTARASSAPTAVVAPVAAPNNTAPPRLVLLGPAQAGSGIATDGGEWSNVDRHVLSYQWRRCGVEGGDCVDIGGAASRVHRLTDDDIGHRLEVEVRAENASGIVRARSSLGPEVTASTGSLVDSIVFLDGARGAVYSAPVDGEGSLQVAACAALGYPCAFAKPRVSPNGRMIVVSAHEVDEWGEQVGPDRLVTMGFDGSGVRVLPIRGAREPVWLANGTTIAFTGDVVESEEPATHIYTYDLTASTAETVRPLVATPGGSQRAATVTSDGMRVAYLEADENGEPLLRVADVSRGETTTIASGAMVRDISEPTFTPDGTEIVFTGKQTSPSSPVLGEVPGVYSARPDGSRLRAVAPLDDAYEGAVLATGRDLMVATRRDVIVTDFGWGEVIEYGAPQTWAMRTDGTDGRPALHASLTSSEVDVSFGPGTSAAQAADSDPPARSSLIRCGNRQTGLLETQLEPPYWGSYVLRRTGGFTEGGRRKVEYWFHIQANLLFKNNARSSQAKAERGRSTLMNIRNTAPEKRFYAHGHFRVTPRGNLHLFARTTFRTPIPLPGGFELTAFNWDGYCRMP